MIPDINESLNRLHKQVVAVLAENARLRDQNARLAQFARHGILEIARQGVDWECGDIANLAMKLGLIEPDPDGYDPAKHGRVGLQYYVVPGDPYHALADWLREDADE